MHQSHIRFLASKDVPYTLNGTNLFEIRKAGLRPIAKALSLDTTGTHNDLLNRIMSQLATLQAPKEIADLQALAPKPEKKKRAKKN